MLKKQEMNKTFPVSSTHVNTWDVWGPAPPRCPHTPPLSLRLQGRTTGKGVLKGPRWSPHLPVHTRVFFHFWWWDMCSHFIVTELASYHHWMMTWWPFPLLLVYWTAVELQRRQWHPTPAFLLGKYRRQRRLVGCSPWGCWESGTTDRLHFHFSLSCIGEGNGNPLQCSCLENPRDGRAWWAAVCGVAELDMTEAT